MNILGLAATIVGFVSLMIFYENIRENEEKSALEMQLLHNKLVSLERKIEIMDSILEDNELSKCVFE